MTAAEYVSRASLELVVEHIAGARDPLSAPHAHYVLLELASADDDLGLHAKLERILVTGLEAGEIEDGVIASSGAQRAALWALRERIPEAERREGGAVKHDVSVRIGSLPAFVATAAARLGTTAGHRLSVFGHIGDGNLHFNVLPLPGVPLEAFREQAEHAVTRCVHETAAELGGSFSAEHGIGVLKRPELERYESPEALKLMRAVKAAIDPKGIMNPGKVLR